MKRLIVPVYLNQRLVFDLLAMLRGGISTVTGVTKSSIENSADRIDMSANFGLSNAFSTLLRVNLAGEKSASRTQGSETATSEERVHTPASLLFELRNLLVTESHMKALSSESPPEPGDIIEFEGYLSRNPIVETLDCIAEMMTIAELFSDPPTKAKGSQQKSPALDYKRLRTQMTEFTDRLKSGNSIDLTTDTMTSGHRAIITLDTTYLNDPFMSDLVDGKFIVLGKVIKSVKDESESISLLRKTALSKMPTEQLDTAFGHLSELGGTKGYRIPQMQWEVPGPAIQVIPIGIYT